MSSDPGHPNEWVVWFVKEHRDLWIYDGERLRGVEKGSWADNRRWTKTPHENKENQGPPLVEPLYVLADNGNLSPMPEKDAQGKWLPLMTPVPKKGRAGAIKVECQLCWNQHCWAPIGPAYGAGERYCTPECKGKHAQWKLLSTLPNAKYVWKKPCCRRSVWRCTRCCE